MLLEIEAESKRAPLPYRTFIHDLIYALRGAQERIRQLELLKNEERAQALVKAKRDELIAVVKMWADKSETGSELHRLLGDLLRRP